MAKKKVEKTVVETEEVEAKVSTASANKPTGINKDGFKAGEHVEAKDLLRHLAEQRKK